MLPATITDSFQIDGSVISAVPFGNGLINDTYKVVARHGADLHPFIIQRINHGVFKDPSALMANVERVCIHIRQKLLTEGIDQPDRRCVTIVDTRAGGFLHRHAESATTGDSYWRCFRFIEGCTSYDIVSSPELAYQAARQFGEFQRLISDLSDTRLNETIPDFHNTTKRLAALKAAIRANPFGRAKRCEPEIQFALENEAIACHLLALHRRGLIPERVTHNDTKISNVLICDQSKLGICVVDLDTVMPGLSLYDFGDLVRTCVSEIPEDSTELDAIDVSVPMFDALAAGFLDAMGGILTPAERENLAFAGKLLAYEVGLRFLTDHLLGDTYFGAKHHDHNLHRARNQFQLVCRISEREPELTHHSLKGIAI
jgi:hypothetical protein